jgi:hypothetical protein
MLFLFAGTPPPPQPRDPKIHVYQPGVYHQSLNPKSGETYYLAPGSYFFGSLNLWKVENVKILGRGTIVYEGTQDPNGDDGWMQKPDWHCVGALEAHNVDISGLTCIVRSRTWSIQMKDSIGFTYDDLRVIGGNPGNANQDGMDWLGGGDSVVRNAFIRSSDDDFAMEGNWDGYKDEDMLRPGHDVANILIMNSVLSTSISNIVRAGWPRKIFNSRNFTLRDSDILHGGIGACGQTFGLLGFWGAQEAKGVHSQFTFENLFLDNWYSLVQLEQKQPGLHGFTFHNIWALDQPPLADSTMIGDVEGVTFDNVKYGQNRVAANADLPLVTSEGAQAAHFPAPHGPVAAFTVTPPVFAPGEEVTFTAQPTPKAHYAWLFGDGTQAKGRRVRHRFPDAEGTQLDGSGSASCGGSQWRRGLGGAGSGGRGPLARCCSRCRSHARRPRLANLPRRMDRTAGADRQTRGLCRRRAESARGCAGLYALHCRLGRLHRYSRRRRLHLPPAGPRWRAPGDRRRGSGPDRTGLCSSLRLAGQRHAL